MSEAVKVAIVGAGLVGQRHVDAVKLANGVEVCAVVDTSAQAKQFAASLNLPFYHSLDELFATAAPDGVLLSTPTTLHVEQGLHCIKQHCPVLIEKPIATTAIEAQQLVKASDANDVPILVGHHRRHNPLIQKAKEIIDQSRLGQIRSATGTCWLFKPDDYFDVAPWRKKQGAGPISVNLVHDIDIMRYLIGDVVRVQAAATKSIRGFENEDVAAAVLEFDNGAIGTITVSDGIVAPWSWETTAAENPKYAPTNQSCLMIGGSEGSMSIPDLSVWTNEGERSWWSPLSATTVPRDSSDPLVNQLVHFADVIKGKARPLVSGLEGMKTIQVIEAIQIAASTQKAVNIDKLQTALIKCV